MAKHQVGDTWKIIEKKREKKLWNVNDRDEKNENQPETR